MNSLMQSNKKIIKQSLSLWAFKSKLEQGGINKIDIDQLIIGDDIRKQFCSLLLQNKLDDIKNLANFWHAVSKRQTNMIHQMKALKNKEENKSLPNNPFYDYFDDEKYYI